MHDAGSLDPADPRQRRPAMADQRIDQRSRRVAGRRVSDEARRLVDDDQMLVLEDDVERYVLAENVRLFRQESEGASTKMTFLGRTNARRLHVAGTVIGVETEEYVGRLPKNVVASTFVVGNDDLARSMLARRHVSLLGEHFFATITVAAMTLDVSEPTPEPEPVIVESSGDG